MRVETNVGACSFKYYLQEDIFMEEFQGRKSSSNIPDTKKATVRNAKDRIELYVKIRPAAYVLNPAGIGALHSNLFENEFVQKGFIQNIEGVPKDRDHQTLKRMQEKDVSSEIMQFLGDWMATAVSGGVAQWCLREGLPAGVFGKFSIDMRRATDVEVMTDIENFGAQVISKRWSDATASERALSLKVMCEHGDFMYTGPMRFNKFIFTTRVFWGYVREDITRLMDDVEANAPKEGVPVHQAYYLFHSDDSGKIKFSIFRNPEDYSVDRMQLFGETRITGERMLIYQDEFMDDAKNLSWLLIKDHVWEKRFNHEKK
jgi:hypothetical protein